MQLFSRRKTLDVQSLMLKVINNHSSELETMIEGPRIEGRVRLTIVAQVTPFVDGRPVVADTIAAVTKEFSSSGVSLVLHEPRGLDQVVLGFRWRDTIKFVRGEAKHLSPMGAGFFQLGVQFSEVVTVADYPELARITA